MVAIAALSILHVSPKPACKTRNGEGQKLPPARAVIAPLTPKMSACLNFVRDFTQAGGVCPTFREIAAGIGVSSTNAVQQIVDKMVERGHIIRLRGRRRGLRVVSGICPTCGHMGS